MLWKESREIFRKHIRGRNERGVELRKKSNRSKAVEVVYRYIYDGKRVTASPISVFFCLYLDGDVGMSSSFDDDDVKMVMM